MRHLRSLSVLISCGLLFITIEPARSSEAVSPPRGVLADPAVVGTWNGVMAWPDKAVHSAMLHTGKVLWYRGEGGSVSTSYLWDPITNQITSQVLGYGVFCSGQSIRPDGRVIVTGGRIGTSGSLGPSYTLVFDPITETWARGPDMHLGRYYPTNLQIGTGETLVFSGYDNTHTINETVERLVDGAGAGGTDQWQILEGANHFMPYYPRMHLLPSGLVFHSGKDRATETFDPVTRTWTPVASMNSSGRAEGTSIILPPGFQKIMTIGGGSNSNNTTEIIDLSAATPAWSYAAPMRYGRMFLNAVILPDGKVLVSGNAGTSPSPSEIYDPATNTWTEVATMNTFREYHSSSVLLPDGRVLWAGTDGNNTGETYSPPYLYRGARPAIGSAPASLDYGQSFTVTSLQAADIGSIVLMRPSATTHSQDMEQRYVPLSFSLAGDGTLSVQAPSLPNTAPPGYYMLFILDRNKIPSVAKFVHLGGVAGPVTNGRPTVEAGPDQAITLPSSANLNGTVSDDGLPAPPARFTTAWRKLEGPGTVTFGDSLAPATIAAFSLAGTYSLGLFAFDGELTGSDLVTLQVGDPGACGTVIDRRVAAGADDAEEKSTGSVSLTSSDLELVNDGGIQTVGLRFTGMSIPPGARILSATVQFTADEAQTEATVLKIEGQDADSAAAFTTATRNVSSRPRTDAFVNWSPGAWVVNAAGASQKTPDLGAILQEIVDRPTWRGRSLALIITGTGHRTADAFEDNAPGAARLVVEIACDGRNRRPLVDAGPDQVLTITDDSGDDVRSGPIVIEHGDLSARTTLSGRVTDDGLPDPPAAVGVVWRKVSGPGAVSFDDSLSLGTLVGIAEAGTYVLSLTAFDGELTASDLMTIVVHPLGGPVQVPQVFDKTLAAGSDDAEEKSTGSVSLTSSDLEFLDDGGLQTVGLRFGGILIPRGARITTATLQFTADEAQSEATTVNIYGQDVDSAATFTTVKFNVSARARTLVKATWSPSAWVANQAGPLQKTPDLSAVVQAVIDRTGWKSGNALAFLFTGTGHRTAEAFEGTGAPRLYVEFTAPAPTPATFERLAPAASAIAATRLAAIFPNPGPGPSTVRFELARAAEVRLEVYDLRGALVRQIAGRHMAAGSHSETWNGLDHHGRRLAKGVYLMRFAADGHQETRKFVIFE